MKDIPKILGIPLIVDEPILNIPLIKRDVPLTWKQLFFRDWLAIIQSTLFVIIVVLFIWRAI